MRLAVRLGNGYDAVVGCGDTITDTICSARRRSHNLLRRALCMEVVAP